MEQIDKAATTFGAFEARGFWAAIGPLSLRTSLWKLKMARFGVRRGRGMAMGPMALGDLVGQELFWKQRKAWL